VFAHGRRFLSLDDAAISASVSVEEVAPIIDRWVSRSILRRGLVLGCGHCRFVTWYALEEVGSQFQCSRCRLANEVVQDAWREPLEPRWYYDLNEAVFQALSANFRVPILATASLGESARSSFLSMVEHDVWRDGEKYAECDIWCLVDGKIIVGEATSRDQLDESETKERLRCQRLGAIASAVTADEFVLATAAPAWKPRTIRLIEEALNGTSLRLLTSVGG
jgi:hypothetical protein